MSEFPIIEKLGGRQAVFERLSEPCNIQTPDAIRMWTKRGRIPGYVVLELMAVARSRGFAVEAADFQLPNQNEAAA